MSSFEIVRTINIQAPPEQIHALVVDFSAWPAWSPWEGLDPELERTYSGPDAGVGATYAWSGNRKAGRGSMQITSATPHSIGIALEFLKPFKASNDIEFTFVPHGDTTDVAWRMSGEQKGFAALFGKLVPMDKLVGKDFEKGLARLKAVAEA